MDFDNMFEGFREHKKTLIITLVLLLVLIIISIFDLFTTNKKDSLDMETIMTSFAEIYYEDLYYPNVKSIYGNDYSKKLEQDSEEGIWLNLRNIVNMFEDVDATKFYQEGNYCNFLGTYVIIYPEYPYNTNDYKIEVNISCEKEI